MIIDVTKEDLDITSGGCACCPKLFWGGPRNPDHYVCMVGVFNDYSGKSLAECMVQCCYGSGSAAFHSTDVNVWNVCNGAAARGLVVRGS